MARGMLALDTIMTTTAITNSASFNNIKRRQSIRDEERALKQIFGTSNMVYEWCSFY
jgi:hypothetical protein